eukprot:6199380-Pleurochrysis_carterae.AAC.1
MCSCASASASKASSAARSATAVALSTSTMAADAAADAAAAAAEAAAARSTASFRALRAAAASARFAAAFADAVLPYTIRTRGAVAAAAASASSAASASASLRMRAFMCSRSCGCNASRWRRRRRWPTAEPRSARCADWCSALWTGCGAPSAWTITDAISALKRGSKPEMLYGARVVVGRERQEAKLLGHADVVVAERGVVAARAASRGDVLAYRGYVGGVDAEQHVLVVVAAELLRPQAKLRLERQLHVGDHVLLERVVGRDKSRLLVLAGRRRRSRRRLSAGPQRLDERAHARAVQRDKAHGRRRGPGRRAREAGRRLLCELALRHRVLNDWARTSAQPQCDTNLLVGHGRRLVEDLDEARFELRARFEKRERGFGSLRGLDRLKERHQIELERVACVVAASRRAFLQEALVVELKREARRPLLQQRLEIVEALLV